MPEKQPDVWAAILEWLQVGGGMYSIQSMGSAVIVTILRYGFMRKKPAFRYAIIDAMICASIAGVTVPICTHLVGHAEFSGFLGTMIGFIGTEKIRDFLFKFINTKVSQQSTYSDYSSYDDEPRKRRGRTDDEIE